MRPYSVTGAAVHLLLGVALASGSPDPLYYSPQFQYVTTTYCNAEDDAAQLWTLNATSNMVFSAHNPARCLSLVPNAVNINYLDTECADAKVEGEVLLDGVPREAYTLSKISRSCSEVLQEFGRWNGRQFHTFSNVVTSLDCSTDESITGDRSGQALWRRSNGYDQQRWIVDNATGAIFNPRSGSCLQIGGALDQQCYGLVKQAGERSVIAPSPFPAYVYPCDRGCDPEGMQRWVFEPVASPPPLSSASPQQQTYRIRLRKNRRFCLRQGIDELRMPRW
jgi:hypothetical protein